MSIIENYVCDRKPHAYSMTGTRKAEEGKGRKEEKKNKEEEEGREAPLLSSIITSIPQHFHYDKGRCGK